MSGEMATKKQVNVDNWGVFFLQRLKHFFNRTDYCDLTLQFQDFAHLKVHRLVLNSCTEYFELLERTCEMYDDCLIMPDDLQADVVVPIVNFMYTGHLEYETSLFDRLYSTAQIMNMTVLTKLLDSQKASLPSPSKIPKTEILVMNDHLEDKKPFLKQSTSNVSGHFLGTANKRNITSRKYGPGPGLKESRTVFESSSPKPKMPDSSRPTRYEVPEELENDDLFESSFSNISYESRPLMKLPAKKALEGSRNIYDEASSSRKFEELRRGVSYKRPRSSSDDNPDAKRIDLDQVNEYAYQQKLRTEYIQQDMPSDDDNTEMFDTLHSDYTIKEKEKDHSFFNYNTDKSQTLSVKSVSNKSGSSLNHAKIISEVLKKYPHLVKTNKNIKLKIMTGPNKSQVTDRNPTKSYVIEQPKNFTGNLSKAKNSDGDGGGPGWSYVNKNMNSESLAKLVSLGAENTNGPWLCLICGTPGKALKFHNYSRYYRHLVDVHKEKISTNICEHCGYKSGKRNHLLHHLYTKHNVQPPSTHSFPKCNQCPYIALTEAFLIKHKLSHSANSKFSCNVCNVSFRVRSQLLTHIQSSGHKFSPDRKVSNQCIYCNKIFLRETNLYTHLKLAHKEMARKDGIIDNSDEEDNNFEYEDAYEEMVPSYEYSGGQREGRVNIKEEYGPDDIEIASDERISKPIIRAPQKLLNTKFIKNVNDQLKKAYGSPVKKAVQQDPARIIHRAQKPSSEAASLGTVVSGITSSLGLVDRIVVLNDSEYILQSDQDDSAQHSVDHVRVGLDGSSEEFILSDLTEDQYPVHQNVAEVANTKQNRSQLLNSKMTVQKSFQPINSVTGSQNQPIQIVVSGNQQYKAIVSSGPLIYSKSDDFQTTTATCSPKYIESHQQNVNIENDTGREVMVLPEGFNIECAQDAPTGGANIVVVYSHPLDEGGEQYLQVDESFQTVGDERLESHMEEIHGEVSTTAAELSDQGLVHETVETWQEEQEVAAEKEGDDELLESVQPTQELKDAVHENVPTEDIKDVDESTNDRDVINDNNDEILQVNPLTIESEVNEVIVSSQDIENTPDECSEKATEPFDESDGPISDSHVEIPLEPSEPDVTDSVAEVDVQANDTEQCMEIDSSQDYSNVGEDMARPDVDAVVTTSVEHPKENVDKLASEWSDDDISPRESSSAAESQTVASDVQTSDAVILPRVQPMEVEESIENIHEEVQKHINDSPTQPFDENKSCSQAENESDLNGAALGLSNIETNNLPQEQSILDESERPEDTEETVETECIETSELIEETEITEESEETLENSTEPEIQNSKDVIKNNNDTVRKNNTEKISNLLNDWDDNDSQSEPMEVDGKKPPTIIQKDPNIEKLVSDWDDEDDK